MSTTQALIQYGPYRGQPVRNVPTLALYLILIFESLDGTLKTSIQHELDERAGIMQGRRNWRAVQR